jgi:nitrilase
MLTFAVCQICCSGSVEKNLRLAETLIEKAARAGADFALLPELFTGIFADEAPQRSAAEVFGEGRTQERMARWAKEHRMYVAGTVGLVSEGGKIFNSCLVYDPCGTLAARYDKKHLFAFDNGEESYDESQLFSAGSGQVTFTVPDAVRPVRVTVGICYDLRFPEHFLTNPPSDVILLPAAFAATTGACHWEPLIRARAIENAAYVAAAGQAGSNPDGRCFFGHSVIADPWGKTVSLNASDSDLLCLPIDIEFLDVCRKQMPAATQRHLEIYD